MLSARVRNLVADEGVPLLVEIVVVTVRQGGPDDLRHGVADLPEARFAGFRRLLLARLLGHVFHLVDDVGELAGAGQHRRVERTPVALLEFPVLRIADGNVVLLDRHAVRRLVLQHPVERGAQVRDAGGLGIGGVVGEGVEHVAAQQVLARRQGRAQVGVVDGDNGQIRLQDQVRHGCRLEQQLEIRREGKGLVCAFHHTVFLRQPRAGPGSLPHSHGMIVAKAEVGRIRPTARLKYAS